MTERATVARPFARAIYEVAKDKGELDKYKKELGFLSMVAKDAQLSGFLTDISLGSNKISEIFLEVVKEYVGEFSQNLVKILASSFKLSLLPEIACLYESYKNDYEKVLVADLVTAKSISDDELNDFAQKLSTKFQKKVNLNCKVEPKIMGGYQVLVGDLLIDGSLKGKLDNLYQELIA